MALSDHAGNSFAIVFFASCGLWLWSKTMIYIRLVHVITDDCSFVSYQNVHKVMPSQVYHYQAESMNS